MTEQIEKRKIGLDLIRGISALLVCFDHVAHFTIDEKSSELPKFVTNCFYVLKHSGGLAVLIFFVLSGYLVGGSVLKKCQAGSFTFTGYFIDRLTRLWMVLLPALLMTLFWDSLGRHWGGIEGYAGHFRETYLSGPSLEHPANNSIVHFLANVGFLQGIATDVYGSNGPLWSLSYEWWYYAAFPLLFIGIRELLLKKFTSAIYLFLATGILLMLSKFMLAFFAVWLAGAAMYWLTKYMQSRRIKYLPSITCMFSFLIMAAVIYKMGYDMNNLGKLAFGVAFAGCIPVMVNWTITSKWIENAIVYLSNVSYSLYLFHYPVVAFFAYTYGQGHLAQLSWFTFMQVIGVCLALLLYSSLWYYLFERNTTKVNAYLKAKIIKI